MKDRSGSGVGTLRLRRTLPARRDKVFKAWIDPREFAEWFRPSAEHQVRVVRMEAWPGGRYEIEIRNPQGVLYRLAGSYQVVEPPGKLVFTWRWLEGYPEAGETLVTIELGEREKTTELVLTHERFPDAKARGEHEKGWGACLESLERTLGRASEPGR